MDVHVSNNQIVFFYYKNKIFNDREIICHNQTQSQKKNKNHIIATPYYHVIELYHINLVIPCLLKLFLHKTPLT